MADTEHTRHDGSQQTAREAAPAERTAPLRTDGATATPTTASPATASIADARAAVAAQRAVFGGVKGGAAFFGWLSANGLAVLLTALLSAAGVALGLAQGIDSSDEAVEQAETLGLGGGIAVLVVLFLAYLAGGYVAGRMARFDGARQGIAVWLIGLAVVLVLAGLGAILGAQYNVLQDLNLPRIPIDEGTATTAGIVTLVALLVVTLLGALIGGKLGERYHRKVDRAGFAA